MRRLRHQCRLLMLYEKNLKKEASTWKEVEARQEKKANASLYCEGQAKDLAAARHTMCSLFGSLKYMVEHIGQPRSLETEEGFKRAEELVAQLATPKKLKRPDE